MQTLFIAGTIGRDAELRQTQSGDSVAGFSVAIDNGKDKNGQKRDATWFDCSIWGNRATALSPYLTKGTRVAITGRPGARTHDGKVYLQCSVDQLTLLGGGQDRPAQNHGDSGMQAPAGGGRVMEDEIPFAPEWRI